MTDSSASEDDAIWAYVAPDEACVPEPPAEEQFYTGLSVVREGLAWLRSWGSDEDASDAAETKEEKSSGEDGAAQEPTSLPDALRDQVAPTPDWTGAVAALDDVLETDSEAVGPPTVVHEAGYHDAPSMVAAWGARQGTAVLNPPPRDRLMERDGAAWVDDQRDEETPWVLPRLERWWLRTPDGLAFVRSLLDAWVEGALGRGVIGVDRHAWRYLRHAWPGQVTRRYALRPLSAEALARWFSRLARQGEAPEGTVEEGSGGGRVLPGPDQGSEHATAPTNENEPASSFLRSLAAYSDGDPGVAWSLWRRSLKVPSPAASASSVAEVPPWSTLDRPERPDNLQRLDVLLLHALVLHGGLPDALLAHVVPVGRYERRERLRELCRAGLLKRADEAWRVPPLGYPVVCGLLRDEAYLSDRAG